MSPRPGQRSSPPSPKCQYQAQQVLILPGRPESPPPIPICSQFCRSPTPSSPLARERSWGPLRRGALHDSPQLSPQNPMMSQMREKGSSGKRQWWSSKTADCPSIDGGLLTEEGGRHCGVLADEKAWQGVQGSPVTFIAASLLVVFLSRPLSADMRVSCNSNGSGLSVAVGGRAPAP